LGTHQHQSQPKQNFQISQTFQSQLDPVTDKGLNDIVESCINQYKNMMLANQNVITNEDNFKIYHEMNKSGALLKYEDSKGIGNPRFVKQYKEILEYEIEQIFKNVKIQLEKSMLEESERNRLLEIEEERRRKEKQIEQDRKYAEDVAKLEEMKRKQKSNENNQKQIQELMLTLDRERRARIEAENRMHIAQEVARRENRNIFKRVFYYFYENDETRSLYQKYQQYK